MPREQLADFYGTAAFPLNYPNEWDKRRRRTGSGIWLHGVPSDTFSRAPQASDGCVVLTNQDLDAIGRHVQVGLTPVIISNGIEWVPLQSIGSVRQELGGALEQWRRDWESRSVDRYLAHYSRAFRSGKQDYRGFVRQKRKAGNSRQVIKVNVDRVSMNAVRKHVAVAPGSDDIAIGIERDYRWCHHTFHILRSNQIAAINGPEIVPRVDAGACDLSGDPRPRPSCDGIWRGGEWLGPAGIDPKFGQP